MGKVKLIGDIDYISGHLRYGHYEVEVDEKFVLNSNKQQLIEYLENNGEIIIDDYRMEDHGSITDVRIEKA